MPRWDEEHKCYAVETRAASDGLAIEREERFRTALLNELRAIGSALELLDTNGGFLVRGCGSRDD